MAETEYAEEQVESGTFCAVIAESECRKQYINLTTRESIVVACQGAYAAVGRAYKNRLSHRDFNGLKHIYTYFKQIEPVSRVSSFN